jgi:hypothetical protein
VLSNFDVSAWLKLVSTVTGSAAPDTVGAFRFTCHVSHELYDDPIVFPNQPGAAHLHSFFGNVNANANSTYNSLRSSGDGSCTGGPANRSSYWYPSMMNGKGKVLRPGHITIYYKREPKDAPNCTRAPHKGCVDIPRGLRFVFGNKLDGSLVTNALEAQPYFECVGNAFKAKTITEVAKNCPMTAENVRVAMVIPGPSCWDGVNLDSADHRTHVTYSQRDPMTGIKSCPSSNPYIIPGFKILASFTINADLYADLNADGSWAGTYNGWHLSSDKMSKVAPGKSVHADWFGAWDDGVLKTWEGNCIDKLLNCSSGNLGNGTMLKPSTHPSTLPTAPRIVDPPAAATTMEHSMLGH